MKLLVRIFCLISIFSRVLTTQSPFEEAEDRDFIPRLQIHYYQEANRTPQTKINTAEVSKDHQEIPHDLDNWENQKMDRKRRQSPYERERLYEYSPLNRNDHHTQGLEGPRIFRTYGKGKAQVTRQGQTVNVPNEFRQNASRGPGNSLEKNDNEIKLIRHRGACRECPTDQTVIASKGNAFSILPEPCPVNPKMWHHHSGPQPGSKIQGVHTIRGYMGPKKKFCQYNYHVVVQQCETLKANDYANVKCSAENYWGSICNITCGYEKEPLGPTQLECTDDLTWSNPLPLCKSKTDCSIPKVKPKSKITCQTVDKKEVQGDFIPNGSTCKFRQNQKDISINCKEGKWRVIRKNKGLLSKKYKQGEKNILEKNDPCNPNPCQNGGICLRPESNKGPPICKCRPQTRGVHCELRECYYNICENDGLCFFLNEERICYCAPEYSGDTCQNYTPQQ